MSRGHAAVGEFAGVLQQGVMPGGSLARAGRLVEESLITCRLQKPPRPRGRQLPGRPWRGGDSGGFTVCLKERPAGARLATCSKREPASECISVPKANQQHRSTQTVEKEPRTSDIGG